MPIDASIYQSLRPVEMPSPADSMQRAMSLKSMATQQQQAERQMAQQDKEQNYQDQMRKMSLIGNTLESISSLPEADRPQAYSQARQQFVSSGLMGEQDAPVEYDQRFVDNNLRHFRQTQEYLNSQKTRLENQLLQTKGSREAQEAAEFAPNAAVERDYKKALTAKVYADAKKEAKSADPSLLTKDQKLAGLNSSDKQRFDNIGMANKAINDMAQALNNEESRYSAWGDNNFTAALSRFEEAVGRMQSGGAIGEKEGKRFMNLARSFGDSPKMQRQKLDELKSIMQGRYKTLGFDPNAEPEFASIAWKKQDGPNLAPTAQAAGPADDGLDKLSDDELLKQYNALKGKR